MSKRSKIQKKSHFFSGDEWVNFKENIERDLKLPYAQRGVIVCGVFLLIIVYQFLK